MFYSEDNLFTEKGNYTLTAEYYGEKDSYIFKCPEYKFSCSNLTMKIVGCNMQNGSFLAVFKTGLDSLDVEKDIVIMPNYRVFSGKAYYDSFPEVTPIKISYDTYLISVKEEELANPVKSLRIETKGCEENIYHQKVAVTKSCNKPINLGEKSCKSNNECGLDEYCEQTIKHCMKLSCDKCEWIKNHRCVPKCNDNNPCTIDRCGANGCEYTYREGCCLTDSDCDDGLFCTTDYCINNKCVHEEYKCKQSDDPCVTASCSEDKGCVYSVNLKCSGQNVTANNKPKYEREHEVSTQKTFRITPMTKGLIIGLLVLIALISLAEVKLREKIERQEDIKQIKVSKTEKIKVSKKTVYMIALFIMFMVLLCLYFASESVRKFFYIYYIPMIFGLILLVIVIFILEYITRKRVKR